MTFWQKVKRELGRETQPVDTVVRLIILERGIRGTLVAVLGVALLTSSRGVVALVRGWVAELNVNAPAPVASGLVPDNAAAGSVGFVLTVNGSNFVPQSVVQWNGANRVTTYVGATQLQTTLTAADLATAGTASVTVLTPAPGGGTSGTLTFTITASANPLPAVTSLSPSGVNAGAAAFTLTVNGSGFVGGSAVEWNGAARATRWRSGSGNARLIWRKPIAPRTGSWRCWPTSCATPSLLFAAPPSC